jgi:hypothetical protein
MKWVSEAGSRALETLANIYELVCLKTGDRVPSTPPEKWVSPCVVATFLVKTGRE